jgi:hypothetical protein
MQIWTTIRIRGEVCHAVLSFLNFDFLDMPINSTFIALILKVKNPSKVSYNRPISLCNVLYKLIAKVLVNRLKKIWFFIISQNQSAFIPGKLITNDILVAYEALYNMNVRMQGKVGCMALRWHMIG